jgi:tripeptide aminopeptidase
MEMSVSQVHSFLAEKVLNLAMTIQQIPAPTFDEGERAAFVCQGFHHLGLEQISVDGVGNVYACLPGSGNSPAAVFSAHLDTVLPKKTDLQARWEAETIHGPGIGDNALGVATLMSLKELIQPEGKMPGDLWLAANVCEEGLGDLRGMKAVVERFGKDVLGYVVLEGTTLGQVYHRALGVQRFKITVQTPGGHSWSNYGKPSAIHEIAALVNHLVKLPIPVQPRTTLNIGVIQGGFSVNTIAAEASMELDLRSEDGDILDELAQRARLCGMEFNRGGEDYVRVSSQRIGFRPAGEIPKKHPLVQLAVRCLEEVGVKPVLGIGSTDANIPLSQGLPAICVGLTRGAGAHTTHEYIETHFLASGLQMLGGLIRGIYPI